MENRPITKKQEEILNYIKDEILERGFPPAVREICQAVGLKSTFFCPLSSGVTGEKWIHPPRPDEAACD